MYLRDNSIQELNNPDQAREEKVEESLMAVTGECRSCGARGHIAQNCPHPKKGNSGVLASEVAIGEGDDEVGDKDEGGKL